MVKIVATVVSALVVVVAAAALGLFLWLRAYAPLSAPAVAQFGPGAQPAAAVEPTFGSGGKTVYMPVYRHGRPFDTSFTLHNGGRFTVTLAGLAATPAQPVAAAAVLDPGHLRPLRALRIPPHESALVVVRWRLTCTKGRQASADAVRLRYRYLSMFTRTEAVALPFAVTLRCP